MKNLVRVAIAAMGILAAGAAWAQTEQPGTAIGSVSNLSGPVTVQRGAQTYTLSSGNQIFSGDRVLTGTGGNVLITLTGACVKSLTPNQSIVVNAQFCTAAPVSLGQGAANTAVATGTGNILPVVGALAAVGAGAAAANGGGSSSP